MSVAQAMSVEEARELRQLRGEGAQRNALVRAGVSAVFAIVAVVVLCALASNQSSYELKEKDVGSLKSITKLMNHLDKLSKEAAKGEEEDKHVAVQVKDMAVTDSLNAPPSVKKGIAHVSDALKSVLIRRPRRAQEAEDAAKSIKTSKVEDDVSTRHAKGHSKAAIAAKMKALQEQILSDFSKVTRFGKKAGYLPPVQMPKV